MRLLKRNDAGQISLESFNDEVPPYAILSHRWGREEVLFQDMEDGTPEVKAKVKLKAGYHKVRVFVDQAWSDGLHYCWVDTCCIDKSNAVELQVAITSMFRWYRRAQKCYVYLADVSTSTWKTQFRDSQWFRRGWTLQELIAPYSVEFFSQDGVRLGDKRSLEQDVHNVTGIPTSVLRGGILSNFSVEERLAWMEQRETTRPEDKAYALFGIFNVYIPLLYGEGRVKAFQRLGEAVAKGNTYLAELRLTDPRDDMLRIADTKGGLFRSASNWIFETDAFHRWRDTDDARLLWIKGEPGMGKTMLLITIIEELDRQPSTASSTALSYFFCQSTNALLNNATAVLRGLIYLLCEQQPHLVSYLRTRYEGPGAKLFQDAKNFHELANILEAMLRDEQLQNAYLVVDALDECIADRDSLLRLITHHIVVLPRVKWIISSRNILSIENLLEINGSIATDGSRVISLEVGRNAMQVARGVEAFIDYKLGMISALRDDHEMKRHVRDIMREKAEGTFLWVALVAKELEKSQSWEILSVLSDVPVGLEELYDRMMQQILDMKRGISELCRLVLATVAIAYRPLDLPELAIVSGLPAELFTGQTNRIREVVSRCGSFLIVKNDIVYLLHQSVMDYLREKAAKIIFPSRIWNSHRDIFAQSVNALSTKLRRNIYDLPDPGVQMHEVRVPNHDPLAGIRYSCIYWTRHLCDASSGPAGFADEDLERINRIIRSSFLYWLEAVALCRAMSEGIVWFQKLERAVKVGVLCRESTLYFNSILINLDTVTPASLRSPGRRRYSVCPPQPAYNRKYSPSGLCIGSSV